jgi:hypothetical protein
MICSLPDYITTAGFQGTDNDIASAHPSEAMTKTRSTQNAF